ncbi:1-deoxy-D-xylulose-5-phosphate synthase [candidate division KSB1 bacterium]
MLLSRINSPDDLKKLTIEEVEELVPEVRDFLIESLSKTGGHLGPNLGVVELTIALHYVFNSPENMIIWDVSHQCYIHKILTGRKEHMLTLRKNDGMPGFTAREESEHDLVDVSHGGTSLSIAMGLAMANRFKGRSALPIAVIGDGSLVEGLAAEALNHIGSETVPMLIVLNDNGRAIDANVGALHNYLSTLKNKDDETYFKSLGIDYHGPYDGHDVVGLIKTLRDNKDIQSPTVIHIKTEKGRGLSYTKESPVHLHHSFPFVIETGEAVQTNPDYYWEKPRFPNIAVHAGKALVEMMDKDKNVVLITPATRYATETYECFAKFPNRCIDVGMAEQHAVTLAAGLAAAGMKPVLCFQSTFFQRSFDSLVHDVCCNNLPVLFLLARSGLAGLDHTTHHSTLDISYLRGVPNLKISYPTSHHDLGEIIKERITSLDGPTVILFPYGNLGELEPQDEADFEYINRDCEGQAEGTILFLGNRLQTAIKLKKLLDSEGVKFCLKNVVEIKPLNEALLKGVFENSGRVITLEENALQGGFGSAVLEFACDRGYKNDIMRVGLPDRLIEHGTRAHLYPKLSIDEQSVLGRMKQRWPELFGSKDKS